MRIIIGALIVLALIYIVRRWSLEGFGPCNVCPASPERELASLNPYRYPLSGSMYRSQWRFAPGGTKPTNSTDVAETLVPGNKSGMNQLTVPDQEFLTN